MTGKRPDLKHARRFGCEVWVRESKGIWVGPSSDDPDGHKVHWPMTGAVTVEHNVRFEDGTSFEGDMGEETLVATLPAPTGSNQQNPAPNKNTRTRTPPSTPRTSY
jgi:hypothetical protein